MKNRVFITGLGVVSPIGNSVNTFWEALFKKNFKPDKSAKYSPVFPCNTPQNKNKISTLELALTACNESLADIPLSERSNVGLLVGTAAGETEILESPDSSKNKIPNLFPYKISSYLAEKLGLGGTVQSISTACSSGAYSIGLGMQMIQNGAADILLVGGVDSLSDVSFGSLYRLGVLSKDTCRPFDQNRSGTVLGEGAAFILIESEKHMIKRKAKRLIAELKGYFWSCESFHPTSPNPSGDDLECMIKNAIADANISKKDIQVIIPHGTGTQLNDSVEGQVINKIFKKESNTLRACILKSKIGHGAGAAGAFSALTGALILKNDNVPPNNAYQTPDPKCALPINSNVHFPSIQHILVNASAFGGSNIALILGRP